MVSRISHTSVDCADAYAQSEWWKAVLDYVVEDGDENLPGHEECLIVDPVSGHRVLFIEVPEAKSAKNRIHFDLVPTDRTRDEEIERVLALGATPVDDLRVPDGRGWVVMADPEGNEFCVLRSDAERAAWRPRSD